MKKNLIKGKPGRTNTLNFFGVQKIFEENSVLNPNNFFLKEKRIMKHLGSFIFVLTQE